MYNPKIKLINPEGLPEELHELLESIAEQVHDSWAAGRLAEGWTYGSHLDEAAKTHPSLIPYEELSEAERDYDRRTAAQTIDCLLKQGYRITRGDA